MIQRNTCPLCLEQKWKNLYQAPFLEGRVFQFLKDYYPQADFRILEQCSYMINQCQACFHLWQGQILDEKGMELLYEHWIDAEKSLEKREDHRLSYFKGLAREIELTILFLNKKPNAIKVLDFGMGWGHWVSMAQAYGIESYGIELSQKRIHYAQNKGIKIIPYENDFTFDYINLDQVLEHVPDIHQIMHYLSSRLNHQGILKIAVPNPKNISTQIVNKNWKPDKNALHPLEHINAFSRKNLIEVANKYQLRTLSPWRFFSLRHLRNMNCLYLIKRCLQHCFDTNIYFEKIND